MNHTKIKFYSYMIFQDHDLSIGNIIRSIDIVTSTVKSVCEIFNGTSIYDGDGSESVQYNDVALFTDLSEIHKETILRIYPFAKIIS
jgi:hypothetical protein